MFNEPTDVAASSTYVYVADMLNHRIRRISTANGWTTTLAGSGSGAFRDGTGAAASFNRPRGVALSTDGLTLYVADERNARIRQIVISSGVVSTLAGSGVVGFADGTGKCPACGWTFWSRLCVMQHLQFGAKRCESKCQSG